MRWRSQGVQASNLHRPLLLIQNRLCIRLCGCVSRQITFERNGLGLRYLTGWFISTITRFVAYRCLHSTAPPYLADELHRVADVDSRRRLRSASTSSLVVPPMRHSTIGDRAFPVAALRVWNSLPSLTVFRRRLKSERFL